MQTIYLDNNATTGIAPQVIEAMLPFLHDLWGNPSSTHPFGNQLVRHIEKAREQVARLVGARRTSEIIFTSCGTESDITAIHSALAATPDKRHIVTTSVEHPAVLNYCRHLAEQDYRVTFLPVDKKGRLDVEELTSAICADTSLVSVMWANNETGVLFPLERIAHVCSEHYVPLHVDAVQAVGKIAIDLSRVPITFLSLSGHKFHAPKGIGALYVRRGTKFTPFISGGHQEGGRRAGTENVASIVALGKAAELAAEYLGTESVNIRQLRDRLESTLLAALQNVVVNGDTTERLPNTSNVGFSGIEGDALLLMLGELGICASSGSACTSGSLEPSHVLQSMRVPREVMHGSIRFSLSRYTTSEEIDIVTRQLPQIVGRLRGNHRSHPLEGA